MRRIRGSTFYPTQADKNRNELSGAKSCSLRQQDVEQKELENLMAKPKAEQQLRNWQFRLEKERDVMQLQLAKSRSSRKHEVQQMELEK